MMLDGHRLHVASVKEHSSANIAAEQCLQIQQPDVCIMYVDSDKSGWLYTCACIDPEYSSATASDHMQDLYSLTLFT